MHSIQEVEETVTDDVDDEDTGLTVAQPVVDPIRDDVPHIKVESEVNQSAISEVDSSMFEFNVNNAYDTTIAEGRASGGEPSTTSSFHASASESSSDKSEDPDLDVPITELAARLGTTKSSDNSDSSSFSFNSMMCGASSPLQEMLYHTVVNHDFTQMSAHQGIKKHSQRAITALFKELKN